jgi:cation transport regulator ChaB
MMWLLPFAAMPAEAALAECAISSTTPAVAVQVLEPPATYRLAEPSETLLATAQQIGTALGRGRSLLGFTLNRYEHQILVATEGDGAGCMRLRSASVVVGASPEVLVDGRFARGTCQHEAILEHENEHVAVFREAVGHYAPMIDAALHQQLPSSIRAATEEEARKAYTRTIRDALDPWLDAIRRRAQDGNNRLDTAENYVQVFRRCPFW